MKTPDILNSKITKILLEFCATNGANLALPCVPRWLARANKTNRRLAMRHSKHSQRIPADKLEQAKAK